MQLLDKPVRNSQVKKSISYGENEVEKLFAMEEYLMNHYGYKYTQLHKVLVRDRYSQLKMI